MKNLMLLVLLGSAQLVSAQITVTISGNIFNTNADSIIVSQIKGDQVTDYLATKIQKKDKRKKKKGDFLLQGSLPVADYYVLRIGKEQIDLVLRDSSVIKVYADAKRIGQFTNIIGSDESNNMNKFRAELYQWQVKIDSAKAIIEADPSKNEEVNVEMQTAQTRFQQTQKLFINQNKNSAALIAMLPMIDPQRDVTGFTSIVGQLKIGFPESPTVQELVKYLDQLNPLAPGKMAPDFEEMKPDSTMMKLSDLRGQVVLLDFWASWCGPCRKENPNVVTLYNKYKDRGFTVMSVSLDGDRERWLGAIDTDNLAWPNHVSDLKKWGSAAAKVYGVGSIPFTVLIDKDGTIIQTKLRGPELEEALERIFGK